MTSMSYNREKAVAYAEEWAFRRNPRYLSFDGIGGDCTSFISQCLYTGSGVMNYTPVMGWYYNSAFDRAPAWSGVPYLYQFLKGNQSVGPFAHEASIESLELGDIIQLGDASGKWYHSLLVCKAGANPYVTTHTFDAWMRPLSSYTYAHARGLHIKGVRNW